MRSKEYLLFATSCNFHFKLLFVHCVAMMVLLYGKLFMMIKDRLRVGNVEHEFVDIC